MTRLLLAAMSGWGKSWMAQYVMETNLPDVEYAAILDYKDEYRGLVKAGLARHMLAGPAEARLSEDAWGDIITTNGRLVIARHGLNREDWQAVAGAVTGAIRSLPGESLTAIDEAHIVAPQREKVDSRIEELATTGRGEGAMSLWVTQRLAKLEETAVSQADVTIAGGFRSSNDRDKLDPEYPEQVHNPDAGRLRQPLPDDLLADGEPVALRKWTETDADGDEHTVGSEWIRADDRGTLERIDSRHLELASTHYGPEGGSLVLPGGGG